MSVIYFLRHGQASFGKANYDRLSQLGELQMRALGEYWLRWRDPFDAVYTGTLERQKASAAFMRDAFVASGIAFPDPVVLPEFNEYDTHAILTGTVPQAILQNPAIDKLVKDLSPDGKPDIGGDKKAFQRLFSAVMDLWVEGRLDAPGIESWRDFQARVNRGIDRVVAEQGKGKNVAVVSSGGPISVAMQKALGCPDKVALDLGWMIVNSSVSEFPFNGNRFSLSRFNNTPHLVEKTLITFR